MSEVIEKLLEIQASQREMMANQQNQKEILDKHTIILEKQQETLIRNTITVETHERRSTALEARLKHIEEEELEPIKDHVKAVQVLINALKWIGAFAGFILTCIGVYQFFKG